MTMTIQLTLKNSKCFYGRWNIECKTQLKGSNYAAKRTFLPPRVHYGDWKEITTKNWKGSIFVGEMAGKWLLIDNLCKVGCNGRRQSFCVGGERTWQGILLFHGECLPTIFHSFHFIHWKVFFIFRRCYGNFFTCHDQQPYRTDSLEMEEVAFFCPSHDFNFTKCNLKVVLRDQTDYYGYVAWGEYPHCFAAVLNQVETIHGSFF